MFDPYHKWLGIPKGQRPPTHYQLLGVSPDEQDPEVIEEAAIRQTTHVRAYQIGQHSAECTQLLKEISAARLTLVNPAKRKNYDAQLAQAGTGAVTATLATDDATEAGITAMPPQRSGASAGATEDFAAVAAETDAPRPKPAHVEKANSGIPIGLLIGVGGGLCLLVLMVIGIAGAWFLLPRGAEAPPAKVGNPIAENKARDAKKPVRDGEEIRKDDLPKNDDAAKKVDPPKKDDAAKKDDFKPNKPNPEPDPAKKPTINLPLKGRVAAEMLVELPKGIFFPSLTNDGLRVAYAPNQPGVICYREAPDFASEHQVTLPGEGGGMVQPAVSSPDGKKMVLIRQQYPGNNNSGLLLWDWRKLAVEAVYPMLGRPERVALAADMKHLAALCMRIVDNKSEFWVQLHEIGPKPVEVKRWKVDFHQTRIGFTPDSSAFFFTDPKGQICHTYSLKSGEMGEMPFVQDYTLLALSADGAQYAWRESNSELRVKDLDANRVLWTVRTDNRKYAAGAGFSPDNHYLLVCTQTLEKNSEDSVGQLALIDLTNGAVVSGSDPDPAIGFTVQLGANGVALAYRERRTARLYRFPTGPGDTFVKIEPPKKEGPVVKDVPAVPAVKDHPPVKLVRVAVPDADKAAESEKAIREQFKKEYAKKAPSDVLALAEKLHKLADETEDDPTSRYVLLRETRDLAVKAGRAELAMKAVTDLGTHYEIDELGMRADTLSGFTKVTLGAESSKQCVEIALQHAGNAMMDDHFDAALKMLAAAETVARRASNTVLTALVQKQDKQFKEIAKEHADMKQAEEKLAAEPKDNAANLTVGLYLTFRKGNWEKGLPPLAQSNDAELRDLAKKDLAVEDDDKARAELGDAWWNGAEKKPAYQKAAMQWRAAHWYRQAIPSLKGLAEAKVADRIKQVDAQPAPFRVASGTGEVDRFKGHKGVVNWLSVSTDGKRLYSGGEDGTLRSWEVATGKLRVLLGQQVTKGSITCFALSPDERQAALLIAGGKLISLHLTTLKSGVFEHEGVPGFFWTSNTRIAYAFKDTWNTWDPATGGGSSGGAVFGTPQVRGSVRALVMAPDQDAGAFLCNNESVITFRAQANGLRQPHAAISLNATAGAIPKDAGFIVLGGKEGNLRAFSMTVKTGDSAMEVGTFKGHTGTIRAIACTPDGKMMISGGDDKTMRVWDVASGKQLQRFVHPGAVSSLVVTPDGRYVISACADSIIRVWSLAK